MNNIKYIIAIDLDGTLLTDSKKITPKTVDFLKKLNNEGHCIVIASGRPLRACIKYQEQLEVRAPIICYNGALVIDPHNNKIKKRIVTLNRDYVGKIIDQIGLENLDNMMLETENHIYLLKRDDQLNVFFWNQGLDVIYGEPRNHLNEDSMTLIFKLKKRNPEFDDFIVKTVEQYPNFNLRFWDDSSYCEAFLTNGTKKHAFQYLAEQLGFDHSQTIAIGDAENDIGMIEWARYGIAMSNSVDIIKNAATHITKDDNNNDGIIEVLTEIIYQ